MREPPGGEEGGGIRGGRAAVYGAAGRRYRPLAEIVGFWFRDSRRKILYKPTVYKTHYLKIVGFSAIPDPAGTHYF